MAKIFNKENLMVMIMALLTMHPLIELDYLLADQLDMIGIPRLTVIIDYIILPLLVIFVFFLYEKRKKKVFIMAMIYGIVFGIYMILHMQSASSLNETLYLPDNFTFSIFRELTYMMTLVIPLVYIWVFYLMDIKESLFKKVSITIASFMGLGIFIANIFRFGLTTYNYENIIAGNILSWFSVDMMGDGKWYATKFFFEEGNTTSILMFLNDCFIMYFFLKEKHPVKKICLGALCFIHALAMMMIGTKVATYGAFLVPVMVLAVYLVLAFLKHETIHKNFIAVILALIVMTGCIIPYSPSYNMYEDTQVIYEEETDGTNTKEEIKKRIDEGAEDLIPYSDKWHAYYLSYANEYKDWIERVPGPYYEEYFPETFDPYFWVELIFEHSAGDYTNGRNLQYYFDEYQFNKLDTYEKGLGLGYSTLMNGSVIIERDFFRQYFSLGYVGFILMSLPWLLVWGYLTIKLIISYKNRKWTMFNVLLMAAMTMGIIVSLVSGHTFDELSTSLFIGFCAGVLWRDLHVDKA